MIANRLLLELTMAWNMALTLRNLIVVMWKLAGEFQAGLYVSPVPGKTNKAALYVPAQAGLMVWKTLLLIRKLRVSLLSSPLSAQIFINSARYYQDRAVREISRQTSEDADIFIKWGGETEQEWLKIFRQQIFEFLYPFLLFTDQL